MFIWYMRKMSLQIYRLLIYISNTLRHCIKRLFKGISSIGGATVLHTEG